MGDARWLSPADAARYLSLREDALPKLVKAGRIPPPSYTAGPRKPRYDRDTLDKAFEGGLSSRDPDQVVGAIVEKIQKAARRSQAPSRR
ncbi:MAG: hypothetical protein PHZ23_15955 [Acidiphilium sp.]|nr:hypothetical protein [Acidiphilium sp.]